MSSTSAPPSATTSTPSSTLPPSTDSTASKTKPIQSIPSIIRVQLAQDNTESAAQADIPANGTKISIKKDFGNLGSPLEANHITILSGVGKVSIFAHSRSLIPTVEITSDGRSDVDKVFQNTDLSEGILIAWGPGHELGPGPVKLPPHGGGSGTGPVLGPGPVQIPHGGGSGTGPVLGPGPVQIPHGGGSGTGPVLGPGPVQLPGSDDDCYPTSGSGTATTNAGTGP